MGKINTYQRRRLASSAVGVAPQDTSGQIIAKGGVALGTALVKRQEALDVAEATKAYYKFVAKNSLETAELQKQYMMDPKLDALTFNTAYTQKAQLSAAEDKAELPARIHNKFDVLVERQIAAQTIKNNTWVMNQQNRNALIGFQDIGNEFNILSGDALNVQDFMDLAKEYDDAATGFRPLVTDSSYRLTTKTHKKSQALSHLSARLDHENMGNPLQLKRDLKEDTEYRAKLSDMIGEKQLQGIEKKLDKAIRDMDLSRGFEKLMVDSDNVTDLAQKVFDRDSGFGLTDMENIVQMESNFLTSLKSSNTEDGQNNTSIEVSEKTLAIYKDLLEVARYTHDVNNPSKPGAKAELIAELNLAAVPFKEDKFDDALVGARENIARQQRTGKYEPSDLPFGRFSQFNLDTVTGTPKAFSRESGEQVKASKTISEYMNGMYEMKGKILASRRKGDISSGDAQLLIAKFVSPLSTLNSYDTVQNKGRNWFSQGYNDFAKYVRNMNLRGSAETNRTVRDTLQAQMMTRLAEQVAMLGDVAPTDEFIAGATANIKLGMSKRLNPAFLSVKPGEMVTINGTPRKFVGFDPLNGAPLIEVQKGLQEAVDNL